MTNKQNDWYIQILEWCLDHALVWTTLVLGLTALDKGFKEVRKRREAAEKLAFELQEARVRKIVQEEIYREVLTRLHDISEKVDGLSTAFFNSKIK